MKQTVNLLSNLADPGQHDLFSLAAEEGIRGSGSRRSDEFVVVRGRKAFDNFGRQQVRLKLSEGLAGAHQGFSATFWSRTSPCSEDQ